ncbi:F-box/LRR-repeat protein 12 [Phtheirospermum japonicum]|uniref:F-box/LRR-repeat protein 12 n=1 Tax=Phtheirospermum japonicum TaxID=374723 RepID=A0A830CHI7_9LAMI|nr:F-box/LRR-repeat protein 12 [Phtheirospermum japonicum]
MTDIQIPDDCLYFIFQRLDSSYDRESFGLTCHCWLRIQNSSRRSLRLTEINSYHLYRLLARFTNLHSLSLSCCTELPDPGLSVLVRYGLKLQRLNLDCCFGITDHGLSYVASGCPFLTIISLYRCSVTDTGLETLSKSCSSLADVNLSYCSLISDIGIRALSENCLCLRAVSISHCRNMTGIGFRGCSNTLVYLEADSCKLDPEGIRAVVSGGGLEYLNISNLSWCVRGHGLADIDSLYVSNLKVLNFRLCRTIGDEAIVKIATGCPLLEEWNLALCHEVRIEGWESIGLNCRRLERLHVNRCQNLCDQGLRGLRDGCKRLRRLYLGRCRRLSWTAVEMFKCLRGDVRIVDEEVMCIAPEWAFRL